MWEYEIRILNSQNKCSFIVEACHADDDQAVRAALRLANGRGVEVWRDLECLLRKSPEVPSGAIIAA
ncbi:MAG: hypothetical protein JWR38_6035 [Mucilaginibacter sp.]|jgi:hypothetical protein|nr:hypothetical protein [Mucilaginibacter sp.]